MWQTKGENVCYGAVLKIYARLNSKLNEFRECIAVRGKCFALSYDFSRRNEAHTVGSNVRTIFRRNKRTRYGSENYN